MAKIVKKEAIEKILSASPKQGKRMIFKEAGLPVGILEDYMVENESEVHEHEGDLWLCLEGKVNFTCNGEDFELKTGDWLWIPPGETHQHSAKDKARLAIIKIPKT